MNRFVPRHVIAQFRRGVATRRAGVVLACWCLGSRALGADVHLTADDTPDRAVSFNSAGGWSDASAPSPGNAYFTGPQLLRTPVGSTANHRFPGGALSVDPGGSLVYSGGKSVNVITVERLVLNGGVVVNAGQKGNGEFRLDGAVEITANGGSMDAKNRPIFVDARLSGTGTLNIQRGTVELTNGANSHVGDIVVHAGGVLILADGGRLTFLIGRAGFANAVGGMTGGVARIKGALSFDLQRADSRPGSAWTVIDTTRLSVEFAPDFSVEGFVREGGVWARGRYRFDERTGTLMVVGATE